jgi:hypothetical protein
MKHTYTLECNSGKWYKLFEGSLQFLQGYLDARKDSSPRLAYRIMRSDGRVMEEVGAREDVSIGQVAGWPTAEQYERAAARALERAKVIREHNERNSRRTTALDRPSE